MLAVRLPDVLAIRKAVWMVSKQSGRLCSGLKGTRMRNVKTRLRSLWDIMNGLGENDVGVPRENEPQPDQGRLVQQKEESHNV